MKGELWDRAKQDAPRPSVRARALEAALATMDDEPVAAAAPSVVPFSPRRVRIAGALSALALAAGVAFVAGPSLRDRRGEVVVGAEETRRDVAIGSRIRAVVEPRGHVAWTAPDAVTQSSGSVFYRVEPGAPLVVHTPAGNVEVRGTCFRVKIREENMQRRDVKSGVVGAAITAVAFVAVYEGKVAVSHAGQSVEVRAGEAAESGPSGIQKSDDGGGAERAFDLGVTGDDESALPPDIAANKNLVASLSDYRGRLERVEIERRALAQELADTKARLAAADGGPPGPKNEITDDEWRDLAKRGMVKYRIPCRWPGGWKPEPEKIQKLGISPQDADVIEQASNRLYESSWKVIRPLCEKIVGKDVAKKLALAGCPNLIFHYYRGIDWQAGDEAVRRVAEMKAGLLPMLSLDDPNLGPVEKVYLVLIGEQKMLENDLARSFGPDEAHRVVTADGFCGWDGEWDSGPREPKK